MEMNIKNLKRIREHIAKVDGSMIKMECFRDDYGPDKETPICKSVGCILGHATILDKENVTDNFTSSISGINFGSWSTDFLGIYTGSALWSYLFGYQNLDIKEYHLHRMDYILAGNKAPNIIKTAYYNYRYIRHYDDGYFITKGLEI